MHQVLNFWLKPVQTIELMDQEEPGKLNQTINILFSLIAILFCLQQYCTIQFSNNTDKLLKAMLCILSIPVMYLFLNYLMAYLHLLFSKLFQGESTIRQIRCVLAFALSPLLVFLPFVIFQFFLVLLVPNLSASTNFSFELETVFNILILCYLIVGLTKVNKFSAGYGLAVAILAPSVIELLIMLIKS